MSGNLYHAAFTPFAGLLEERFAAEIHTTEDSIRYLLFSSLLTHGGLTPNDITLEYPTPTPPLPGRQLTPMYCLQGGGRQWSPSSNTTEIPLPG